MNDELKHFLKQLAGVVGANLLTVIFTAFIAVPWQLQYQPGAIGAQAPLEGRHMT